MHNTMRYAQQKGWYMVRSFMRKMFGMRVVQLKCFQGCSRGYRECGVVNVFRDSK